MALRACIAACVLLLADAALSLRTVNKASDLAGLVVADSAANSADEDELLFPGVLSAAEEFPSVTRNDTASGVSPEPSDVSKSSARLLLRPDATPQITPPPDVTLNPVAEEEFPVPGPPGASAARDLAAVSDPFLETSKPVPTGDLAFWPPTQGNGLLAWMCAAGFVVLIASVPILLQTISHERKPSVFVIAEGVVLLIWLIGGLYIFTHIIQFKSPHFGGQVRSLTLVEAVYVFAQIITTVGYGDVIPAYLSGQLFLGFFVFCAILLIAAMVSELSSLLVERAEKRLEAAVEKVERSNESLSDAEAEGISFVPLAVTTGLFAAFVLLGMAFYHLYPGEGKTWGQGLYMSIITLTTVGFGAVTPNTEMGMVFGAFWMVFGVAVLGGVVTSFAEVRIAMKKQSQDADSEAEEMEEAKDYVRSDGKIDLCGYICYKLQKKDLVKSSLKREQLSAIITKFETLDTEKAGAIDLQALSARKNR